MTETLKKNIRHEAAFLSYQFRFGSDEKLYTVSFKGIIPEPEICRMLESARMYLYRDCAEAIHSYLDRHSLPYSDFISGSAVLKHSGVMASAGMLLHTASCQDLDKWTGNADICYALMDHQKWIYSGCEGCCYAVMKTHARYSNDHRYHIIGQTFQYHEPGCTEQAYFAIRTGTGTSCLYNIETNTEYSVLPSFGSVDMINLLLNIRHIHSAGQAEQTALQTRLL